MPAKDGDIFRLSTGKAHITVECATTSQTRARGLSFREYMPRAHGMLFIFDTIRTQEMWMKDMLFPLDIVWLDEYMRVVTVDRELMPCKGTICHSYSSRAPIKYALELNAGDADRLGAVEGTVLKVID